VDGRNKAAHLPARLWNLQCRARGDRLLNNGCGLRNAGYGLRVAGLTDEAQPHAHTGAVWRPGRLAKPPAHPMLYCTDDWQAQDAAYGGCRIWPHEANMLASSVPFPAIAAACHGHGRRRAFLPSSFCLPHHNSLSSPRPGLLLFLALPFLLLLCRFTKTRPPIGCCRPPRWKGTSTRTPRLRLRVKTTDARHPFPVPILGRQNARSWLNGGLDVSRDTYTIQFL